MNTVQMLAKYKHTSGKEMVIIAASSPELDDYVELWKEWPIQSGTFRNTWRGTWKEFSEQWEGPINQ